MSGVKYEGFCGLIWPGAMTHLSIGGQLAQGPVADVATPGEVEAAKRGRKVD